MSFLHSFLRSRILSKWCKLYLEAFEDNQRNSCTFLSSPSLSGGNCHRGKLEGEGFKKCSGVNKDGSCSNKTKVKIHLYLSLSFYLCSRDLCAPHWFNFFCNRFSFFHFLLFFGRVTSFERLGQPKNQKKIIPSLFTRRAEVSILHGVTSDADVKSHEREKPLFAG